MRLVLKRARKRVPKVREETAKRRGVGRDWEKKREVNYSNKGSEKA